jgi:hypothetical protein
MVKITKPTPQDNIPKQESKHKGIPVTDVKSAQAALLANLETPYSEQPQEEVEQTEVEENTSEQAMENAESVEEPIDDSNELTVDDLVDNTQEEETQEPSTYTVKVDGKDVEVTLDELQSGYSRQADYTQKSQVLAEQRRKADEELAATQQERQKYISQLEQFNSQADSKLNEFKTVDWEKLKEDDPMAYMTKRDAYRELQENKRLVADEQQNLQYKQQQESQQQWHDELGRQQEIMAKRLPEWADPAKGAKLKQNIKSFAMKKGFNEQEVNSLIDARSVDVLHKAMLYENLLETKISKKKAKVVPKVTKPGTGTTRAEVSTENVNRLRKKARKSGGVNDAAKYLESLL